MNELKELIADAIEETSKDIHGFKSKSFVFEGEKYTLGCSDSRQNKILVTFWAQAGRICLVCDESIETAVASCVEAAEKWQQGMLRCSDCGKWISYEENKTHQYFAGIYCQHCWDSKWCEIEAHETYE